MKSKEYWEGRFIELQRSQLKRADSFAHELEDLHQRMQKEIDDDITVWYKKVATANGISMADAKKLMSRKDRKEFQWTLEEYEQHAKADLLSGVTSANVMNASANWHLSYLDGMKLQLEHHVDKLYKNIDSKTRNHFKESLNENYLNTAFELQKGIGIGEKMEVPYDERKLENILRTPWASDGKNFSNRIWRDRTQLVNNLQKNLSESVIRGDSDTDMIQALSKDEKKAEFNTRRLVETESAFFDSESERQCCEDFGIEKYRFLAVLDMKTSDICQELDNKVFLEKERQVGVNAPPMHPFCRSTTAPVVDEEFLTSRRAKNIKTGEYDEIPPDMNYKEWKEKYVEGKENAEEVKQEQVKTESSNGAKVEVQAPKVESEYKETPIPPREEKFDSEAYEERVNKRANKQAVNIQAEPATIEIERPVNYGNTEKVYSEKELEESLKNILGIDINSDLDLTIKTIKNDLYANRFKKDLGITLLTKGLDLEIAEEFKGCYLNTVNIFPKMKADLLANVKRIGEAQIQYDDVIKKYEQYFIEQEMEHYKVSSLRKSHEEFITNEAKKTLKEKLGIGDFEYLPNQFREYTTLAVTCYNEEYYQNNQGIYFHSKRIKKYLSRNHNNNSSQPEGCYNYKGIINHEIGHIINRILKISDDSELIKIYNDMKKGNIKKISDNALDTPSEFVAEIFSAYLTTGVKSDIVQKVLNIIESKYNERYNIKI